MRILNKSRVLPVSPLPKKNICPTNSSAWTQGTITAGTVGTPPSLDTTTTSRIRVKTSYQINPNTQYVVSLVSGYQLEAIEITAAGNYVKSSGWRITNQTFTTSSTTSRVFFRFSKVSGANLTPIEIDSAFVQVEPGSSSTTFENYTLISKVSKAPVRKILKTPLTSKPIKDVCLYYGYPSVFIGGGNDVCAQQFATFDIVIWGEGYQFPNTGPRPYSNDYSNAIYIAQKLKQLKPDVELFGYVAIGGAAGANYSISEIKRQIDGWKNNIGATGCFLDEFGYDYGVTRERQNEIVSYCHSKGMNIIANSWIVDYVFSTAATIRSYNGNPNGILPVVNSKDYILFENMFFDYDRINLTQNVSTTTNGKLRIHDAYHMYNDIAPEYGVTYYQRFGTRSIALDNTDSSLPAVTRNQYFITGYLGSVALNIDAYCMSKQNNGAGGGYSFYSHGVYSKLSSTLKQQILTSDTASKGYPTNYKNIIGKETLELVWIPDSVDPKNSTLGTHQVLWNGNIITSIP